MTIIPVYKPTGMESSEVVRAYKDKFPGLPVMHAGALDPLAEGLLLLVIGAETHADVAEFIRADKTYEFEILVGFCTDTWDILGITESIALPISHMQDFLGKSEHFITNYTGSVRQRVPIFSNMRYRDKRMYQWAREGNAHVVPPLFRERMIHAIKYSGFRLISAQELYTQIRSKVQAVHGDFRQEEILKAWESVFDIFPTERSFPILQCQVTCESGTYVRSIAHALGEYTGRGAASWHIRRTAIGEYSLSDVQQ